MHETVGYSTAFAPLHYAGKKEEDPLKEIRMLDSVIALLCQPDEYKGDLENDAPDMHETVGYSTAFARLHYAGKKEEDPLKEIRDPKELLVTSIAKLSALARGRYPTVIEKYVGPSCQAAVLQMCGTYNCAIG